MSVYIEDLRAGIGETYNLLLERFRLFSMLGVIDLPKPGEERVHLIQHADQYLEGREAAIATHAALDREYMETLPPVVQRFMGALIGAQFGEDQLLDIAQIESVQS